MNTEELNTIRQQDWLSSSDIKRLYSSTFGNKNTLPRLLKKGLFRWKRLGDADQCPIIVNHSDIKRWLNSETKQTQGTNMTTPEQTKAIAEVGPGTIFHDMCMKALGGNPFLKTKEETGAESRGGNFPKEDRTYGLMTRMFEDNPIRITDRNGNPWFIAKDVASVLGYSKPSNAISRHCKGALKQGILTKGGSQQMTIIPESDVFRLIIRSKLPTAERFEKWVMEEVLPSIRKTGGYSVPDSNPKSDTSELMQAVTQSIQQQGQLLQQQGKIIETVVSLEQRLTNLENSRLRYTPEETAAYYAERKRLRKQAIKERKAKIRKETLKAYETLSIRQKGKVTIGDMAEHLDISETSVRNRLKKISNLAYTHGIIYDATA